MNSSIHALRMFLVMSAILAATALACSNNYWNKPPQWPHALTRQMCAHSQRSTSRMAGLQAPAASLRDHDIQHNNVHQHTATSTTTSTSMSTSTTSSTTSTSTTSTTSSTTIARCVMREKNSGLASLPADASEITFTISADSICQSVALLEISSSTCSCLRKRSHQRSQISRLC